MARVPDAIATSELLDAVRDRYSAVAQQPAADHGFPVGRAFAEAVGYPATLLDGLPAIASAAFAGVACPVPSAGLVAGDTVVDLGCGGGLDSLYAARLVAPGGKVIGVDFSPAMVARARTAANLAGADAVIDVRLADGTALPVADGSADVVIVNGIFNLNPDKRPLIGEIFRVLAPGGRLVAAEIILTTPLPDNEGHTLDDWFR